MANVTNLQNTVVTGGKFVSVSSNSLSMRERLKSLQTIVSNSMSSIDIDTIKAMLNDNVLTPTEKASLKDRWDSIVSGYSRLVSDVKDAFGESEMESMSGLQILYEKIYANMLVVLSDMNVDSKVPAGFSDDIQEFTTRYADVSQMYSRTLFDLQKYTIAITTDKTTYNDDENVTVTATLSLSSVPYEGSYSSLNIDWNCTGMQYDLNDYKVGDGHTITFPANLFGGSISIDCSMEIPISTP